MGLEQHFRPTPLHITFGRLLDLPTIKAQLDTWCFSFVSVSHAIVVSRHDAARRNSPREAWEREGSGPGGAYLTGSGGHACTCTCV